MPNNEKEYNGYLLDQLAMLERIEEIATEETVLRRIAQEKEWINRKLYQQPPLTNN